MQSEDQETSREIEYQGIGNEQAQVSLQVRTGSVDITVPGLPGVPHLTERQVIWLTHRLAQADDLDACVASRVPADEVVEWRVSDPAFSDFVARCLEDKRSNFRDLTSHLLPHTAQVLYKLLTSENPKDQAKGAQMMLRHQGQFLDVSRVEDADALGKLLDKMRQHVPVEIVDVKPRP